MASPDRLLIVHHGLVDRHSHYYGQTRAWLDACRRRGIAPRLYVNNRAAPDIVTEYSAIPAFTYPTDIVLDPDATTRNLADFLEVSQQFAHDCSALERDGVGGSDVVLVTFANERDLLGAALWLERIPSEGRPTFAFIFYGPDFDWRIDPQRRGVSGDFSRARYAMKRLRAVLPAEKTIVLAMGKKFASVLPTVLRHPCEACVLPKYFTDPNVLETTDALVTGRTNVLVAGEFRAERGASLIAPVFLRLAAERQNLKFAIQVNEEKTARIIRNELAPIAKSGSQCRIDYGQIPPEIFQKRLLLSDIVLLPFLWWRYALRGSGVFTEAVGLGIVTVVPDRTWMSDMLAAGWGAGTVFREPTVESVAAAVAEAIDAYPTLKEKAGKRAAEWRRINSADTIVDQIFRLARAS